MDSELLALAIGWHVFSFYWRRRAFYRVIHARQARRRRRSNPARARAQSYICRPSLPLINHSPWSILFGSGDDRALMTATGFTFRAFNRLLSDFEPLYHLYAPTLWRQDHSGKIIYIKRRSARGRPRSVEASTALGLVLMWLRSRSAYWTYSLIFGMTKSNIGIWLNFGVFMMKKAMKSAHCARIELPGRELLQSYVDAVYRMYPSLPDCWAMVDGLKLALAECGDVVIQNAYYNGWVHGASISNVFVFAVCGCIAMCSINAPGSWHDSQVAESGGVYDKIAAIYEKYGLNVIADSAFPRGSKGGIVRSNKINEAGPQTHAEISRDQSLTSARQPAEWGMRALQGAFPRLTCTLPYEERGFRKAFIGLVVRLHNARTRLVGVNQIRAVYMRELLELDASSEFQDLTLEQYDEIPFADRHGLRVCDGFQLSFDWCQCHWPLQIHTIKKIHAAACMHPVCIPCMTAPKLSFRHLLFVCCFQRHSVLSR